jgi:hypothetical protein
MGRGDVGSSIGEDGEQSQCELCSYEAQPNASQNPDGMPLRLIPREPEGHANGQSGQHCVDTMKQVHVDLESCNGINPFPSARVAHQGFSIRLGPPLAISQGKVRNG